jgi:hypothetical protein
MTWTEDVIAQLTDLWERGKTANQIAEMLGMTRNMVLGKVNRLGLTGRGTPVLTTQTRFKRVCDRVIEGVNGEYPTIAQACAAEGLLASVGQFMWNEKIERTHGGEPT